MAYMRLDSESRPQYPDQCFTLKGKRPLRELIRRIVHPNDASSYSYYDESSSSRYRPSLAEGLGRLGERLGIEASVLIEWLTSAGDKGLWVTKNGPFPESIDPQNEAN